MTFRPSIDPPGALRLHYNENVGCSPAVLEALARLTPADIAAYPEYTPIRQRLAGWLGVNADRLTLTNGLDDGLLLVAQYGAWHAGRERGSAAGSPPAEFIIVEPAFESFGDFAAVVRARVVRVGPGPSLQFPLGDVIAAITPATRVVYLIDPNNPTGLPLPPGAAERIAAAAPHALVLVDEAYADYSGRTLIGSALDRHPNLVVGRTFAKGHGLAALRIGALVGQAPIIERLSALQPPFAINYAAVVALDAALGDAAFLRQTVAAAAESRDLTYAFCRRHGIEYWPSEGNFVLMRVGPAVGDIVNALAARGILARDKSSAPGCAGCLRFTTGLVANTERVLAALEEILASRTN